MDKVKKMSLSKMRQVQSMKMGNLQGWELKKKKLLIQCDTTHYKWNQLRHNIRMLGSCVPKFQLINNFKIMQQEKRK
jgi:fructose-1,6-bisphosphatase